jgi:hypothetical protein
MLVKIKSTLEATRLLHKVNVPTFVIENIQSKTLEIDEHLNVKFDWLGQETEWNIPAECVEIVEK